MKTTDFNLNESKIEDLILEEARERAYERKKELEE